MDTLSRRSYSPNHHAPPIYWMAVSSGGIRAWQQHLGWDRLHLVCGICWVADQVDHPATWRSEAISACYPVLYRACSRRIHNSLLVVPVRNNIQYQCDTSMDMSCLIFTKGNYLTRNILQVLSVLHSNKMEMVLTAGDTTPAM